MGSFRVMTWNVQNLFEVGADAGPDTTAVFNAKVSSLAAVIDRARPHVVALQELGPQGALDSLQQSLQHPMRYSVIGVPDSRGIRVGFLSQRVIHNPRNIALFPPDLLPVQASDDPPGPVGPTLFNQIARPALQVTVRANNTDVTVISCHLKSKLLSFPTGNSFVPADENQRARYGAYALYRRASEATTLRTHITDLMDDGRTRPVVLAGDMNDEVDAATTQILNGPPGSEIGTLGFDRPDKGDTARLFNLAPQIPEADRYSRIYRGRGELIDHIFASHLLAANGHTVSVDTYTAQPALPSIDDDPTNPHGPPGSDHAAIMATFNW